MAYKADLISSVVAQAHGLPDALNGPVSEVLVGVCEVRDTIITSRSNKPYFCQSLDAWTNCWAINVMQTICSHPSQVRCRIIPEHWQNISRDSASGKAN